MKLLTLIFLTVSFATNCFCQNFTLDIKGNSPLESKCIDSLKYNSNHTNIKSINDELNAMSERLSKIGYIENHLLEFQKKNDSSYSAKFNLGERIKFIHIYIGQNRKLTDLVSLDKKKDTLIIAFSAIESFLNSTLQKLEQNGFAFANLKLTEIKKLKNSLFAELKYESGNQRLLNAIVINFNENNKKYSFPKGHLKQINRKFSNKTFNRDAARKIQSDFGKFGFVNQIKTPEVLFTQDSTKIYVYLEKRKSNTFDGFVGFANSGTEKLRFNGYLDLKLENTIKAGELFSLFWKSDGNNQKTFKASIDLPYIFQSPLGLKAQINIFKQDSIFQNTKTNFDLGYLIDYNTRLYLGYQATESSDIQNTNTSTISDFKNTFLTLNLELSRLDYTNSMFSKKTNLSVEIGFGKRATTTLYDTAAKEHQTYININATHNFYLNSKNSININYQNYFLKSTTYIISELYRFGGAKSIRGFAENSLQANFMTTINTEYRYITSSDFYLHSIFDYGYYQDKTSKTNKNLIGIGLGTGLRTKNGILKLSFSNGISNGQSWKFQNSIVSINYNIEF